MSDFNIYTIREMIEAIFEENNGSCPVNFNMLESVLFILARRMELLQRRFKIEMRERRTRKYTRTKSTFMVTEIKIHTLGISKRTRAKVLGDKLMTSEDLPSDNKHRAQKRSGSFSYKTASRQYISDDNSSDISSSDDRFIKGSGTHKRSDNKYLEKKRPGKTYRSERPIHPSDRRKGRNERRDCRKYSDDSSPAIRHREYKGKSPARRRNTEKYSDEMSFSRQRKSQKYFDEMFTAERRKARKYSSEVSPSHRRKSKKYFNDIYPAERREAEYYEDIFPTERHKSAKSPAGRKTYGEMERRRSEKHDATSASPSDGNRAGHYNSPSDEHSTDNAIRSKSRPGKQIDQKGKTDGRPMSYSGKFKGEESSDRRMQYDNRDKRHQQASDDDLEAQHEKILVVTRTPSGRDIRGSALNLSPVVTQEQYNRLLAKIRQLQKKFTTNRNSLTQTTSITHPGAALNMSVRLNRAESRLASMLEIVTQLASQVPGRDLQAMFNETSLPKIAPKFFKIADLGSKPLPDRLETFVSADTGDQMFGGFNAYSTVGSGPEDAAIKSTTHNLTLNVTFKVLNDELRILHDTMERDINMMFSKAGFEKCGRNLEKHIRIVTATNVHFQQIAELNYSIENIDKTATSIDERMTSQMAIFQDSLHHMQSELEMALEKVAESILSPKEDPTAVAQMTETFQGYNNDVVQTDVIQLDLKQDLEKFSEDLITIARRIEGVRIRKCSRQQMFEALDNKLSLHDVNGLLARDQFGAVMSETEDKLKNLYLKIISQECDWQLTIESFDDKCDGCADFIQVKSLQESMLGCFNKMDRILEEMSAITMTPKKYKTNKKLVRDEQCLSCGTSPEVVKSELKMKIFEELTFKTAPGSDIRPMQYKYEENMAETCIPGQPIPHPLEQDSYICTHDCGKLVDEKVLLELYGKKLEPGSQSNREDKPQVEDH